MARERNEQRLDMRYASPDFIRPNPTLVQRTAENFKWNEPHLTIHGPSPSNLPIPSEKLTRKIVKGKNRTWIINNSDG